MKRNRALHPTCVASLATLLSLFTSLLSLRADQIEMQNGDHYLGKILSLTTNTVVLQSEVLGAVTLPRSKVAQITVGSGASTNPPVLAAGAKGLLHAPLAPPATVPKAPPTTKEPASSTQIIQKVESQYLSDATPEARQKFNDLAGGFLTGRLSINDIRKEAKSAADQLRALRGDAGDDTGMIDSYLAILDNFLKESPPSAGAVTNAQAASTPKPTRPLQDE